jgi:hypothetical protein
MAFDTDPALHAPALPVCGTIPIRLEVALAAGCSTLVRPIPARQPAPDSGTLPASGAPAAHRDRVGFERGMEGRPMRIATRTFVLALATVAMMATGAQAKATASQSCEAAKEKDAGKAAQCRLAAAAKFAGSAGGTADIEKRDAAYAKCQSKMSDAYAKADAKYGTDCAAPDNATTIDALTAFCSDEVVRLNQPPAPTPTPTPTPDGTPTPTPCAVHAPYTDNGDGTVSDSCGLIWEKKTDDGGVHDKDNTYTWTAVNVSPWPFDGTAATVFLATLNTAPCFAGSCDWRLPTLVELGGQEAVGTATGGIVDLTAPGCGNSSPCINAIFGPTASSYYWSSSTYQDFPYFAWGVNFGSGNVGYDYKANDGFVRAVRSGS